MTRTPPKALALAAAALLTGLAGTAHAGSQTNTMNNIVSVQDACDIVAIGMDFGVTSAPLPTGGVTVTGGPTNANTGVANTMNGNATNPHYAKDGGAGNDDVLTLNTPVAAVSTALSTVVGTALNAPGVYVACTVTPTSVSLTSPNGGTTAALPTTVGSVTPVAFTGKMIGVGGSAGASNAITYKLNFLPAVVSTAVSGTPVSLFTGLYTVTTGTIAPADQTGNSIVVGQYWDGAVATLNY